MSQSYSPTTVSIVRQPDDRLCDVRISLGRPRTVPLDGLYLVFRGEPKDVIEVLDVALELARQELPDGRYVDERGRPQG